MNKKEAQQRVDQVRAFQAEHSILQRESILSPSVEETTNLQQYHTHLLSELAEKFDVDTSHDQKKLSWGMRLASLFGALALSAAVFFFFYHFWGKVNTGTQIGVLVALPILAILGIEFSARYERSMYFASLLALVAVACFVLNISVLGKIFNILSSPEAFLIWAGFALLIAYGYGLKLILVASLSFFVAWLAARVGTWNGMYWLSFGERPENFIFAGLVMFVLGLLRQHKFPGFAAIYRVYGLLVILSAILILANWGAVSYLPFTNNVIENSYQILGFLLSSTVVWLGIKYDWRGFVNLGSTFFVLYLYTKLFDWFWEWMPKYLFFLLVGLVAMLVLFVLHRLRDQDKKGLA